VLVASVTEGFHHHSLARTALLSVTFSELADFVTFASSLPAFSALLALPILNGTLPSMTS
jgi:hypothetical protein